MQQNPTNLILDIISGVKMWELNIYISYFK